MKKNKNVNLPSPRRTTTPCLWFSPTAWAKLLFLRDYGDTEVGGFGITAADDLLYLEDIRLVKQVCTWAHVAFADESVADLFDEQVDAGRRPEQFARIWIHTHPGDCPRPSATDEKTFDRVFGSSQWAVMFILAHHGQSYARLRFNVGPQGEMLIPVDVDYSLPFSGSDESAWEQEYLSCVQTQRVEHTITKSPGSKLAKSLVEEPLRDWYDGRFEHFTDEELRGTNL